MKTYKRLKNTNAHKALLSILATHDKMKNSYHWRSPSTAGQRFYMEQQNSQDLDFMFRGSAYQIEQRTRCSCANVYYSLRVHVNGMRKDVRAIRRLVDQANGVWT